MAGAPSRPGREEPDVLAEITAEPIDPSSVLARVGSPRHGASVLFLGTVRNHNDGRPVAALHYEAYAEMARDEISAIAGEVASRAGDCRVAVVHRTGTLGIGEISVAVAVSTPHRAASFESARAVMEEIKRRLPVWKKERYADDPAGDRWLDGTDPAPAPAGDSPAEAGAAPSLSPVEEAKGTVDG